METVKLFPASNVNWILDANVAFGISKGNVHHHHVDDKIA